MSSMKERDWLEEMLRSKEPVIEDRGFTQRVLTSLPPRNAAEKARTWIIMGAALVGCLLGLLAFPTAGFVLDKAIDLFSFEIPPVLAVSSFGIVFVFLFSIVVTSVALLDRAAP